jgi:hypothetical protein
MDNGRVVGTQDGIRVKIHVHFLFQCGGKVDMRDHTKPLFFQHSGNDFQRLGVSKGKYHFKRILERHAPFPSGKMYVLILPDFLLF